MIKKILAIICFLFVLVLVACNNENATSVGNKDDEEVNPEVEEKPERSLEDEEVEGYISELDSISLIDSRETLKEQQGGILVENITIEEEISHEESTSLDSLKTQDIKEELENLINHTQDPPMLYKGFVYLLGSPHYKETIEKAEQFESSFEEPELPYTDISEDDTDTATEAQRGKSIILLDASSSMLLPVDGRVKMDIAKEAVKQFGEVIGQNNDVSLVVYGHKGSESESDKELSCNGIEEVYPLGEYNKEKFEASLETFNSKGYTPLAGAINKAKEMSEEFTEPVTVYIVSDGVETCDGNPVKAAEAFVQESQEREVNIIGFHVDKDAETQLKQVSEAGNGSFYSADNADELNSTMEDEWLPSYTDLAWAHTKAPGPWEILDEYDRFDEDLNRVREIIKSEKSRFDQALQIMKVEELVDRDVIDDVAEIVTDEFRVKLDLMSEFRSEKLEEIDKDAEEIREQVDKWKEEMRQRKQERGDMF
ncbi:vWA domain-containing protein [Oceanobacillus senegalensis]|uniref:vWA domain-containing protein n=1 Tax=Oceanobacillus senegalensis TaxID=1936063 RepID=UPI000A306D97|nr:VWA domain-containing protein [Oceanobacillus senegalensis]